METNKINYITIQQYLDGKLDKEDMHELERQALDDPFLADALDGYGHINKPAEKQLSLLQTQLAERIAQQQENKNVLAFSWQRLSIAAAAGLLFITAGLLFGIRLLKNEEQLASQPKKVEVSLMPKDSVEMHAQADGRAASETQDLPARADEGVNKELKSEVQVRKTEKIVNQLAKLDKAESTTLNEVVVSGYATQKRAEVTGAVANLSGRAAGVSLSKSTGITGKVVTKNGDPLPGASVFLKGRDAATVTDVNGEFHLNDSINKGTVTIASVGFESKEVKAKAGKPFKVELEETTQSLNEVVVTGYGTAKREKTDLNEFSEPVTGWSKYKSYLKDNIQISETERVKGKVVVVFRVSSDNKLSDFKIEKGINERMNQEAIRLIKEGPAWQVGKQQEVSVTVKF